jgi:hypothetical protein
MADQKTRIGPALTQQDGLKVREVYLRLELRVDIYVKEKWREVGATHKRHLYQSNVGHMPYVERGLDEVQATINELVDACTADTAI